MNLRLSLLGLTLLVFGAVTLAGCGKGDRDPKPVNIKPDPRLKITGDGGGGGPKKGGDAGALD
jgi:hypothetical protein